MGFTSASPIPLVMPSTVPATSVSSGGSPEEAILFASCDSANWWIRLRWPRSVDRQVPSLRYENYNWIAVETALGRHLQSQKRMEQSRAAALEKSA